MLCFFTGIYYRPASLKSMTALLGNGEHRTVYKNFELKNLHVNSPDFSHSLYEKYLKNKHFIPPGNHRYWAHTVSNMLPTAPSNELDKGLFNVYPLDLDSSLLDATSRSTLGIFPPPSLSVFPLFYKTSFFQVW